jgi:predicted peptidase
VPVASNAFAGLITIGFSTLLMAQSQSDKPNTDKMFESHQYAATNGDALVYRMLRPESEKAGEKYPLVIFLHGAGERGNDNKVQLKHGLFELCTPERRQKYACFVVAPQCPKEELWAAFDWRLDNGKAPEKISRSLELTLEVVDQWLQDAPVDADRIYITGLSMGGYGTWDAISRRPDFFAAAMPICGGGDPATAEKIKHIPIACFHGADDKVVVPERSRQMIEAIRQAGGNPKYVEYSGVAHDSWKPAYASDDSWQWMFEQRRSPSTQSVENTE